MTALEHLGRIIGVDGPPRADDQRVLARALGGEMLAELGRNMPYTGMVPLDHERVRLDKFGERMMDAMWPEEGGDHPEAMATVVAAIAHITDPAVRRAAGDMLARLGHMHQMAGLLLRDFELEKTNTPTTAQAFLSGDFGKRSGLPYNPKTDAAKAVAALNAPRLELTFTAHPTNTNSLSSMIAQREIAKAVHAWRKGGSRDDVAAAFRQYANAPLLPERAAAPPGLSVRDEVQTMLYFLNNAYSDLDRVYDGYDKAMTERFADYDPSTLRLGLRYHSWGSSADKDGNANVNADTTLYAMAAHYQQMLKRYQEDLTTVPHLDAWKTRIDRAQAVASEVLREVEQALDASGHLSEAHFDRLSRMLQQAVAPLDRNAFIADLEKQLPSPGCLELIRHAHTFGFSFGTLEFRETAEEFTRIIAALLPEYPADETGRCAALDAILKDPEKSRELAQRFQALAQGAEGVPYSKQDVKPIAYQTRKRLELARDFPPAIDNHVLAECQDMSNLLELLVLQHAVTDTKGQRATMGIIPLFEDAGPLTKAPAILRAAMADAPYRSHLDAVAAVHGEPPAQQVQLAHSDNARRNGEPASRALIYRAHQQLRAAMDDSNAQTARPVKLQLYEGGSLSDPYRGGVRALSAAINEYGLHDFSKVTVQGGDLLNYFNLTDSIRRLLVRNITHNASRLERGALRIDREEPVIDALARSMDDYKVLFHSKEVNDFCDSIGFLAESKAGNTSSRASIRPNGGGHTEKVDVTKVRTISFSEGFQHAGLCPTWIGSAPLTRLLNEAGIETSSPRALNRYYKESPLFKDAIDRMLYGLVRTDMPYLAERSGNHPLMARFEDEYAKAFTLCLEAYTGKAVAHFTKGKSLTAAAQHQLLIDEVYPHIADVLHDQDRFTTLARTMKKQWLGPDQAEGLLPMTLHNAMDTVLHGRLPLLDDPTYATLYCRKRDIVRPHVTPGTSLTV